MRHNITNGVTLDECAMIVKCDLTCGVTFEFNRADGYCGCGVWGSVNESCPKLNTHETSAVYILKQGFPEQADGFNAADYDIDDPQQYETPLLGDCKGFQTDDIENPWDEATMEAPVCTTDACNEEV